MPAGRPRKYFTKEEKDDAHRKAVSKHYYKNWDEISARRKLKRDEEVDTKRSGQNLVRLPTLRVNRDTRALKHAQFKEPANHLAPMEASKSEDLCPSQLIESRIESLRNKLAKILQGKSTYVVLADICTEFEDRVQRDVVAALDAFTDPIGELERTRELAEKYQEMATKLEDPDLKTRLVEKAHQIQEEAQSISTTLEGLLTEAIMGPEAFVEDFRYYRLQFQLPHRA